MTAQNTSSVRLDDEHFALIAADGGPLASHQLLGISHVRNSFSTGGTGPWYEYGIEHGRLVVLAMELHGRNPPELASVSRLDRLDLIERSSSSMTYDACRTPIEYSGHMLAGGRPMYSLFVHGGVQSPHAFERVVELVVNRGAVLEVIDRSADCEWVRSRFAAEDYAALMTDTERANGGKLMATDREGDEPYEMCFPLQGLFLNHLCRSYLARVWQWDVHRVGGSG